MTVITLRSQRLRLELADPGEAPNNGFRFDRAGFVTEVVLDGTVRFCASEPKNLWHPCSGGRGLSNEYRLDLAGEAEMGGFFPKFGIGLFRKEKEGRTRHFDTFRDVRPFPVSVQSGESSATYLTQPVDCMGYAMRCEKTVSVEDNLVTMVVRAENTGEKALDMREFCHNFLSIDGMAVGSDYLLEIPGIPDQGWERLNNRSGQSGSFRGHGRGYSFCEHTAIATDIAVDLSQASREIPFCWKLTHRGAGAFVAGEEHFTPSAINIWAVDHMVCPEVIHHFPLEPGASHRWKRTWRFDTY